MKGALITYRYRMIILYRSFIDPPLTYLPTQYKIFFRAFGSDNDAGSRFFLSAALVMLDLFFVAFSFAAKIYLLKIYLLYARRKVFSFLPVSVLELEALSF